MPKMPELGRPARRKRRSAVRVAALLLVLAGAAYAVRRYVLAPRAPDAGRPGPVAETVARDAAPAGDAPPAPPPPTAADVLQHQGLRYVKATVAGPLETAFVSEIGRDVGEPLTQVVTRLLVWWVTVPDDLRRGDVIEVLFSERPGAEPLVHAVRFTSEKAGKAFAAYRFQVPGASYARYYTPDGQELELRLRDAPLDDHEQVTSLIRDGRNHRGVDFRVPLGTPVKATFDAVVVRKNFNFPRNGNCLELRELEGSHRTAYFLHLSEISAELKPGDKVQKGQIVARSGNTGHSFAPHLHYQLMTPAGTILDPFASEPTLRLKLPDAAHAAFDEEVKRLDGLFALVRASR